MTYRHVPLHGEKDYSENRSIRGHLGAEALDDAERFSEGVRLIRGPEAVQLNGQPGDEQQHVRDGHAEEIVVSRRMHVPVVDDDDAGDCIADGAQEEDDDVENRHGDYGVEALSGGVVRLDVTHVRECAVHVNGAVVCGVHVELKCDC